MVKLSMRFTLFGIPFTAHFSFFITSALLAYGRRGDPAMMAAWIAVVTLAVVIHELGHAVFFRYYGHQPSVELAGLGGLTFGGGKGAPPLTLWQDAVVTAAGPGAGFALAALVWAGTKVLDVPPAPHFANQVVIDLLWVSAGWGVLNLIPILPLDGGQLARIVMTRRFGPRAERIAPAVSVVTAVVAAGAAYAFGLVFGALMAVVLGFQNAQTVYRQWRSTKEQPLVDELRAALEALDAGSLDDAKARAKAVLQTSPSREVQDGAMIVVALVQARMNDPKSAWEGIQLVQSAHMPKVVVDEIASRLFQTKAYKEAEGAYAMLFTRWQDPNGGYNAACSAARRGDANAAFSWLKQAVDAGVSAATNLERDDDLTSLRSDPRWAAIVVQARTRRST